MALRRFGVALIFAFVICGQVQAVDCAEVEELSPKDLVSFLGTSAYTAAPQCVDEAMIRLGESRPRDKASVEILVSLLDFRRPESEREKMHISSTRDWFPAVSALVATGTHAVETLVAHLRSGKMTETARQNGIRAILYIYSEDPPKAVSILKKAAKKAETQVEAVALESCAGDAAKLCAKTSWKSRCEAALKD